MKRLMLFLTMVFTVYLGSAQTGTVINDLQNNPTLRKTFLNAITGPSSTTGSASVAGVLPVGLSCGFGSFAAGADTVVIPGYRPTSTIIWTNLVNTTGTVTADSTIIVYGPVTGTSTVDTVVFVRNRTTPASRKFVWGVLQW